VRGLKGRSSSPNGRKQRWGSRPPTKCKLCRVVDPSKKVPDLKCEVPDLLLEVADLKQAVPDLRSGGIPLNLTPGYKYRRQSNRASVDQSKKRVSFIVSNCYTSRRVTMSSSEKQDQQPHEPAFVIAAPQVKAKFHYTYPTRTRHGQSPRTMSTTS